MKKDLKMNGRNAKNEKTTTLVQMTLTSCMLSTQQGMRQHGMQPMMQRTNPTIQPVALSSEEVLEVMCLEQWGQVMVTAWGPYEGPATY